MTAADGSGLDNVTGIGALQGVEIDGGRMTEDRGCIPMNAALAWRLVVAYSRTEDGGCSK